MSTNDDLPALDAGPGDTDELGTLMARLASTPEGREALHKAKHCDRCGAYCHGRETAHPCTQSTCVTYRCPDCGNERGAVMALDCPACHALQWWERPWVWVADHFWTVWYRCRRGRK